MQATIKMTSVAFQSTETKQTFAPTATAIIVVESIRGWLGACLPGGAVVLRVHSLHGSVFF
jgi:hypothetical protein